MFWVIFVLHKILYHRVSNKLVEIISKKKLRLVLFLQVPLYTHNYHIIWILFTRWRLQHIQWWWDQYSYFHYFGFCMIPHSYYLGNIIYMRVVNLIKCSAVYTWHIPYFNHSFTSLFMFGPPLIRLCTILCTIFNPYLLFL